MMKPESKIDASIELGNALVGLYVWDRPGETLFRITRVDVNELLVWYELIDPFTANPSGEQGSMDAIELMELVKEGDYEIYSQREVLARARPSLL